MSQHDAIQFMMRHPSAHVKFMTTGRLPVEHRIRSALVDLLEKLGPGRLGQIRGLTIDHRLGYMGSRDFPTAAQGLRWLKPSGTLFSAPASESHQIKSFQQKLYLEDLEACCHEVPQRIFQELRHLTRPK